MCKKVIGKIVDMAKEKKVDVSDQEGIHDLIRKYCKNARINKENRFVSEFLVLHLTLLTSCRGV